MPFQECRVLLPYAIRTALFEYRDNSGNGICWIILQQDMDVILIRFHTSDIPIVFLACFKQTLFDIIPECPEKQFLPVLGNKNQMNHEQVLIVSSMLINIFHIFLPYLLQCTMFCVILYIVIITQRGDGRNAGYRKNHEASYPR